MAIGSTGSANTRWKFSSPTHDVTMRFVFWKLITTALTMGTQENTPKITSIGSANTRVLSPPPRTQVAGERLLVGRSTAVSVVMQSFSRYRSSGTCDRETAGCPVRGRTRTGHPDH